MAIELCSRSVEFEGRVVMECEPICGGWGHGRVWIWRMGVHVDGSGFVLLRGVLSS